MDFIKINGYDNYSININGDVRNDITGLFKKKSFNGNGYYRMALNKNNITKQYFIHRLIAEHFIPNPDNKLYVDHKDNNRLNNCIENLRWVSNSENCRNRVKQQHCTSIYKGVCLKIHKNKRWGSHIQINKKQIHLGYYTTEEEAGHAYDKYIIDNNLQEYFKLNFTV